MVSTVLREAQRQEPDDTGPRPDLVSDRIALEVPGSPSSDAVATPSAPGRRHRLAGVLDRLAYHQEGKRDLRIDLLRGFAVFAMIVDHLAGPSVLYVVTGGNRFFTSAAEGFVFISGFMVGMVYGAMRDRDGPGDTLRRLLARGWQLYVLAIGLALVMIPISELLHLPWADGLDLSDPVGFVLSIVTLRQTYYLIDVPLLYALLLLIAPAALLLMCGGRTWVVLLFSWILWAIYQFFPRRAELPWDIAGNYLFAFSAWQVLFFTAMALGYHRERVPSMLRPAWRGPLLVASGIGFGLLLLLSQATEPLLQAMAAGEMPGTPSGPSLDPVLVAFLFSKGTVGPGRLLASAVVFTFFFLFITQFWRPLHRMLAWLLLPLGQNALFAYSAHVALAVAIGIATGALGFALPRTSAVNAAVQVAGVGLIWLAIRYRVLIPTKHNQRWWMASPVPIALALIVFLPVIPASGAPGLDTGFPPAAAVQAARVFGTPIPRDTARNIAAPPSEERPRTAPLLLTEEFLSADYAGTLREVRFYSPSLDREMPYLLYLPPEYDTATRRYPVLLMLHGLSGSREEWPGYGLVGTADELIFMDQIQPLLIVMPQGDFSYWVNLPDGRRYRDYISQDLVRHIQNTYRVTADPADWGIGGLSMGGFGALTAAFRHPDVFGVAGAHSPSLPAEGERTVLGEGQDFAAEDPIQLADLLSPASQLTVWVDSSDGDPWLDRVSLLLEVLERRGVPNEVHVFPGEHWGGYWMEHVVDYLFFYDRALHRLAPGSAADAQDSESP
jgi:enterochelin esterase-like enzyme